MRRVKRRIFTGSVCEQIVYNAPDRVEIKDAKPKRIRFKDEAEREKHKTDISRRRHARKFQANFSPESIYTTLTFDDEHEVHTFQDAKRVRDNYCRRLLRACPGCTVFIYMGRGKSTSRIHFHMVTNGVPEDVIVGKWRCGSVLRTEHLREHNYINGQDRGRDYSGLANYLFNHWTAEQGGHRWKQAGEIKEPDVEPATECKRDYTTDKPPIAPKGYILVESMATPYGYLYFRYVVKPERKKKNKKQADREPLR